MIFVDQLLDEGRVKVGANLNNPLVFESHKPTVPIVKPHSIGGGRV